MTKGQRAIVALLAVVAVLLGLNLLRGTPEAEAQVEEGGHNFGACSRPDGSCALLPEVDCNLQGGVFQGLQVDCISADCFPVRVVAVTVDKDRVNGTAYRIFRAYSNGDVDMTWVDLGSGAGVCDEPVRCGPVSILP